MPDNSHPSVPVPEPDPEVPSAISEISLSQAILAPLDALFKAQVHAARSFLNLLLQIGSPDIELDEKGDQKKAELAKNQVYTQDFVLTDQTGNKMQVSIPAISLVPVTPLSIENARFNFTFKVEKMGHHVQMQTRPQDEKDKKAPEGEWTEKKRPWYLVDEPVSFKGNVAPTDQERTETGTTTSNLINIEINLARQPLPAGLDKLLTALQQASKVTSV